jgi:DNA polymerase III subunit alpha
VLLLVQNLQGYRNLCELLSKAFLENQYRGRAEIKQEWLVDANAGLIVLSGFKHGDVGQALLQDNLRRQKNAQAMGEPISKSLLSRSTTHQRAGKHPVQETLIQQTLQLASAWICQSWLRIQFSL